MTIKFLRNAVIGGLVAGASSLASASTTSSGLPWESPLKTIQASLSGPVAGVVAVAALFAAGAALVFGEDMSGFVKKILLLVIAISLLIGGNAMVTSLWSGAGALL